MSEIGLQDKLCNLLLNGRSDRSTLPTLKFSETSTDAQTVYDLVGHVDYRLIREDQPSDPWNQFPDFMIDVIGGMQPDVVLRSKVSDENRIYFEIKWSSPLGYNTADSQIVRYFLHLLAASHRSSNGRQDIRRAVVLVAPNVWTEKKAFLAKWQYFFQTYRELASLFDITLALLRLELA